MTPTGELGFTVKSQEAAYRVLLGRELERTNACGTITLERPV